MGACFAYATCAQSEKVSSFFEFLKDRGYRIEIIHFTTPDEVRVASIHKRDEKLVQTIDEDIVSKACAVAQRIQDYLTHSNSIKFYYREEAQKEPCLAATWTKNKGVTVLNPELYEAIKDLHNSKCPGELTWDLTVEKSAT